MGFSHKKRIDWTLRDVTSDRSALKVIALKDFKGQCPIDQVFGLFGTMKGIQWPCLFVVMS